MSLPPRFRVNSTVGTGHSRANDVIRIRKAYNETGHGRSPAEPSGVWDPSAMESTKGFQIDFGLKPDAVVRPGGPTERAFDIVLGARRAGGPAAQAEMRSAFHALKNAGFQFTADLDRSGEPAAFSDRAGQALTRDEVRLLLEDSERRGQLQLASAATLDPVTGQRIFPGQAGTILGAGTGGGAASGIGALIRRVFGDPEPEAETDPKRSDQEGAKRTVPADDIPKGTPPFPAEPPPDPDKGKEQIKAEKQEPTILKGPDFAEIEKPTVMIFPDFSDQFNDWLIVERRGNEETREYLEQVRDFFTYKYPYLEHIAGGREKNENKIVEKPEYYVPNPAKDFEEKFGITIDGRRGSKYADLTFRDKRNKKLLHVQTVDLDKYGKPTARELENAEIIRKRTGATVLLIAKPAQLRKPRNK